MGVIFDGVVWAGLAMIWAGLVGVASVLELVFKNWSLWDLKKENLLYFSPGFYFWIEVGPSIFNMITRAQ